MDYKELGKRIKELRLAKKLTQSELVSDFITRSMLSQIESGSATPSMRTLEYIAQKLQIPVSELVPDQSASLDCLLTAKRALAAKDYDRVLQFAEKLPVALADEAYALKAKAHLELAKLLEAQHRHKSAADHAHAAASNASQGVYASRHLRADALLLLDEAEHSGEVEST
ncbi:MAG: helix-turn-helix transcriptional regulator [Peptococcaceae bacterium]|nr:helix-turn-helix transcriptional regulator [Peptococcaceae bacterium]